MLYWSTHHFASLFFYLCIFIVIIHLFIYLFIYLLLPDWHAETNHHAQAIKCVLNTCTCFLNCNLTRLVEATESDGSSLISEGILFCGFLPVSVMLMDNMKIK